MKPGSPPPPPPDDEAADPLLAALRQRLGDYGQAPPPGAWAAIRRQVAPAALPQPWWRRRPPLVLLGLLLCCLLPGKLSERAGLSSAGKVALERQMPDATQRLSPPALVSAPGKLAALHAETPATESKRTVSLKAPVAIKSSPDASHRRITASQPVDKGSNKKSLTSRPQAVATTYLTAAQALRQLADTAVATTSAPATAAVASATQRKARHLAVVLADGRKRRSYRQPALQRTFTSEFEATEPLVTSTASKLPTGQLTHGARHARLAIATPTQATRAQEAATEVSKKALGFASRREARVGQRAGRSERAADRLAAIDLPNAAPTDSAALAATLATPLASSIFTFGPLDSLTFRLADLPLPAPAPLATLVARPDSTPPVPPARRWALLVVAGPTLSHRTLGPAPVLAPNHPDFARLERPALGLGAQVQVRRVLSGRWALAVGLGYHEYATRLALSVKDSSSYTTFHQRDMYRLLTVPVQASYALGAPKGRLSKGLLLGIEPGWYLGGRSTEGSGCGCEQQVYSSAARSPYYPLSMAVSLGLDLRYRLGAASSRWQWLVQPTGRYVATPFVHSEAVGFTRRQPFSLGLLTGFSWDVR